MRLRGSPYWLLCPKSKASEKKLGAEPSHFKAESKEASLLSVDHAISVSPEVFLQTFVAILYNVDRQRKVRFLLDSGSQRSYILRKLAQELEYKPKKISCNHSLEVAVWEW